MKAWLLLLAAVAAEVTAALSLNAALDTPAFYVLVAVGYVTSFVLLSRILRAGIPLGVAYGVWGALGVATTAVLAAVLFGEALTARMLVGIAMVIVGVIAVEVGSQRAAASQKAVA